MATTTITTENIRASAVQRSDLNVSGTAGTNVIAKVVQGTGISISSTGGDSGTGDVTINATATIGGSVANTQIAVGAATANTIQGDANFTYSAPTVTLNATTNVLTQFVVQNNLVSGATASDAIFKASNPGTNGNLGQFGIRSFNSAAFGALLANDIYVYNAGTNSGRLVLISNGPPIAFGTPNESARVGSGLMVGSTTDPGAGYVNAATGYKLNNTALSSLFYAAITAQVAISTGVDTYLTGTKITVGSSWKVGGTIRLRLHLSKTAAGTGAIIVNIRAGTAGTTSDTAFIAINFGASTAAVDTGIIEVFCTLRGIGASATGEFVGLFVHNVVSGGLWAAAQLTVGSANPLSAAFNTTTATILGVSVNGGTGNTVTIEFCELEMVNP
jgi:hypothetical protein